MDQPRDRLKKAIAEYYLPVLNRFRYLISDTHLAEDLTQEVFSRFWKTLRTNLEIRNQDAFITAISQRVFIDHLRKKRKGGTEIELDYDPVCPQENSPDTILTRTDDAQQLRRLLELLPAEEQHLITGRHFFDMTGEELARSTGVPRRTATDRYNRAMKKLRNLAIQRGIAL